VDLLNGPARAAGSLFGRGTRTDKGLHITGPELALSISRRLPEAGALAPDRSPERIIDRHQKALVVGTAEQQVLTVLMHANQLQVLHAVS
jgi:hypothetical protein